VVDVNKYPLPEIEEMTLNTRKIGLGVMGVGDLFCELEISYASRQSLEFMERLMETVNYFSKITSMQLSKERGRMPYFDKSFYKEGKMPFSGFKDKKAWHFDWADLAKKIKRYGIRNGFTTVIAPTGSISMIAGTSSGIEPIYSLVFEKNVAIGSFYYIDPVFEEAMRKAGLMDEDLIKDTARLNGSIKHINYIPEKYKKTFITAMDISPADHVRVLAAFQKWVDSSISKTNNFPAEATVEEIKKVYLLAYELGCKGVTVYRDKSLHTQVLVSGSTKKKPKDIQRLSLLKKDEKTKGLVVYHEAGVKTDALSLELSPADDAFYNNPSDPSEIKNCPVCKTALARQEGCRKCPSCGWGLCS
jgi:ribonucleoside-diphosphate reductase alpha chain